jgi:Domain of unknown function (DUF4262)
MLDKFEWPKVEDEADEIVIRNVRKHGCHIVGIWDGEPPYVFSIGLFLNYHQPEIVIFGLDGRDSAAIINDVRDRAAKGQRYTAGDVSDELLVGYRACFVDVPLQRYDEYLGTAIWFYYKSPRPFPCLQMVWPDRDGRFPWDTKFDPLLKARQPLLSSFS